MVWLWLFFARLSDSKSEISHSKTQFLKKESSNLVQSELQKLRRLVRVVKEVWSMHCLSKLLSL
eukprot:3491815-Amphidinium_carterae.1